MGTLKLNTTSGGSLSIQAADGASDNTLTIPSATGNILTDSSALPALDGSALTNLPASSLTGALPALDGSALTNLPAPAALSTASGSAPSYSARAWVNFNGTGTVAIRNSGNVSSITDNGTGDYTINFSTSMPDVNYCVQTTVEPESAYPNHVRMSGVYYNTRATGSVRLRTGGVPSELGPDPFGFFAVIFR